MHKGILGEMTHGELTYTAYTIEDDALRQQLRHSLRLTNHQLTPSWFDHPDHVTANPIYDVMLTDENGVFMGGMTSDIQWHIMRIDLFWVREDLRGQGIGSKIMTIAEDEAQRQGCLYIQLTTFDFQARGFYEKIGYDCVATLDDYPPGHQYHVMRKYLKTHKD